MNYRSIRILSSFCLDDVENSKVVFLNSNEEKVELTTLNKNQNIEVVCFADCNYFFEIKGNLTKCVFKNPSKKFLSIDKEMYLAGYLFIKDTEQIFFLIYSKQECRHDFDIRTISVFLERGYHSNKSMFVPFVFPNITKVSMSIGATLENLVNFTVPDFLTIPRKEFLPNNFNLDEKKHKGVFIPKNYFSQNQIDFHIMFKSDYDSRENYICDQEMNINNFKIKPVILYDNVNINYPSEMRSTVKYDIFNRYENDRTLNMCNNTTSIIMNNSDLIIESSDELFFQKNMNVDARFAELCPRQINQFFLRRYLLSLNDFNLKNSNIVGNIINRKKIGFSASISVFAINNIKDSPKTEITSQDYIPEVKQNKKTKKENLLKLANVSLKLISKSVLFSKKTNVDIFKKQEIAETQAYNGTVIPKLIISSKEIISSSSYYESFGFFIHNKGFLQLTLNENEKIKSLPGFLKIEQKVLLGNDIIYTIKANNTPSCTYLHAPISSITLELFEKTSKFDTYELKIGLKNDESINLENNEIKKKDTDELDMIKSNPFNIGNIKNPSEKLQLAAVIENPYSISEIKNPTEKVQLEAIKRNPFVVTLINNAAKNIKLSAIELKPDTIQFLEDPIEELKIAAVEQNGLCIKCIKNPSEKVKLEAVKQNGLAIKLINHPSEELKLEAVKNNGLAIKYIKNPSKSVKLESVKNDGNSIQFIINPSEDIQIEAVKQNGLAIKYIKDPSEKVKLEVVKQSGYNIQYIENPSEKPQIEAVKQNGHTIQYIKDPSELVQIEAVKQNGYSIRYIKNPSELVQLEAVKKYGNSIQFIENPSELVQLEAVKKDGLAIQYIQNPSEQVQLEAIKQNGNSIRFIINPSEIVQLKAIEQSGSNIYYIKNPSEQIQIEAVKQDKNAFQFVKNSSELVQLEAVKNDGYNIYYIKNPSEQIQIQAVKQSGFAIEYIQDPSEEVQLEAVKQNGYAVQFIKNSSEKVKLEAVKQNGLAIQYIKNPSEKVKLEAIKQNELAIQYIKNKSCKY